jgi:hypothetical protein
MLLTFRAVATNDIHVCLATDSHSRIDMVEVVLGGWNNSVSVIRYGAQGLQLARRVGGGTPARLRRLCDALPGGVLRD